VRFFVRYAESGAISIAEQCFDADSESELRQQLRGRGYVLLDVRSERPQASTGKFDVSWWCRELRTLLTAGMTVVEAVETMASGQHDQVRHGVHVALLGALRQGQSLSKALRGAGVFPEVLIASVTASERTSNLPETLADYLRYSDVLDRLKRQAVSAAIYPAVVIGLGAFISLFLLVVVIPRFSRMYVDSQVGLSTATHAILWVSRLLQNNWYVVVGGLIAMMLSAAWAIREGLAWRALAYALDHFAPLRRNWDQFRLAKLFQSLAMMFKGGYTLDEGLIVCQSLQLGPQMLEGLHTAHVAIMQGRTASLAFQQAGLTEEVTFRLLAVGERSGSFDVVLQTIAERHAQNFETFVERSTRIIEPLLLLVVALVVGGIVVMMYMPIFDMAGNLGGGR
jgi:general secretion pathway protein F